MEKMYEDYRDIAAFLIIYIREAHAADGNRPVDYAKELVINEHKTFDERRDVARRFVGDKEVRIPTIIDNMDGEVDAAYGAAPTRAYIIRKDGRLGVTCGRGPRGLEPALKEINVWLEQYRETGEEPGFPQKE